MDPADSTLAPLHQQAIQAALCANWQEALDINLQIIEQLPQSVEVLNRVARAYFELGDLAQSKKFYEEALKNDPYNQIAAKFLKRIAIFKQNRLTPNSNNGHSPISTDLFIKEPGKTKLVNLVKLAEPQKLSLLSAGCEVSLMAKNHSISVTDLSAEYLGILPDDVSHHLIRLIKGGNRYQCFIKSIKSNAVSILIKEVFRAAKFKNQPSFPESDTFAYSSDHIPLMDERVADSESPEEEEADS